MQDYLHSRAAGEDGRRISPVICSVQQTWSVLDQGPVWVQKSPGICLFCGLKMYPDLILPSIIIWFQNLGTKYWPIILDGEYTLSVCFSWCWHISCWSDQGSVALFTIFFKFLTWTPGNHLKLTNTHSPQTTVHGWAWAALSCFQAESDRGSGDRS